MTTSLSDRVEAATADQQAEMLEQAWRALNPKPVRVWEPGNSETWTIEYAVWNDIQHIYYDLLHVGAFLDAAMSLVPEGFNFGCGSHDATGKAWAWCEEKDNRHWEAMYLANAVSPALALTAASLRARGL